MTHQKPNMPGPSPVLADRQDGQSATADRPVLHHKVLIIDDDAPLMRSLERGLRGYGWTCTCSTVPMFPAEEVCGLIDWDPHGRTAAAMLRYRGVPFVVLTGAPEAVPVEISRHVTVLAKPCSIAEIDRVLRVVMGAKS